MSMKRWLSFTVFSVALASGGSAMAEREERAEVYQRVTVFTFDAETIDAGLDRPDAGIVISRRRAILQNLLKLREDFRQEVLTSAKKL
jgi:hypothetical protein